MIQPSAFRSIQRHLLVTLVLSVAIVGSLGVWAATTELAGAVIAPGVLVVESNVKKVQHPVGGVVAEIKVVNGDRVEAGQIVGKLDDTQTRANLDIVLNSLDELMARKTRLDAEKNGAAELDFPGELTARKADADVAALIAGETRLFELRRDGRNGQKSQLRERATQLEKQIEGLAKQSVAKDREISLIDKELAGVAQLWDKKLVSINRLTALQRDAARLDGERGQLMAAIAETKAKIAEIELAIIQVDQDLRSEVGTELADVRAKLGELRQRKVAAEDQLKHVDLRAPQAGFVHQLSVHTVGGVVGAGDTIMAIVPSADALTVEAKVSPQDIDELHLEQEAVLRFSAFDVRTTPELNGSVTQISADLTEDERTGQSYYTVRIAIPQQELVRLGDLKLIAGMPVEAFIQTQSRTALSYLTKPLFDHAAHAFRES